MFRLNFITVEPVIGVSVTLGDNNVNAQTHTLIAFDGSGNVVDEDSFAEDGLFPGTFTLTVSSSTGIAFIVAIEQPFGAERLELITYTTGAVPASIDIKPGSFPNSVNPNGQGVIPVAILTTDDFDATTVDPSTVLFGPTGTEAAPVHAALEDVDGDGDLDLVLHFKTQETGIQCGDISASLIGQTFDGQAIEGSDSVNTVGCK